MASIFDRAASVIAADLNIGSAALYTPQGEAPLALRVVLSRDEGDIAGLGRPNKGEAWRIMIARADVPDRPRRGELISVTRGADVLDLKVETAEADETGSSWQISAAA